MKTFLSAWRLPLRLAARDLRRYKGRSALAALLIFLPVFVMASALTALTTFTLDDREQAEARFRGGVQASVQFDAPQASNMVLEFPAAGRTVSYDNPPNAAEVAKQSGRPTATMWTFAGNIERTEAGPYFPSTYASTLVADLHSPVLNKLAKLVDGRLPSKPGEGVITDYGSILGIPSSGKITVSQYGSHPSVVTMVGRVRTTIPDIAVMGFPDAAVTKDVLPQFALGGKRPVDDEMVASWARYGAVVTTPNTRPATDPVALRSNALLIAIGTMGFVVVVALLAGPAFAAGATRHRRALGLFGANGASRAVLRRIVLAQALTLGALTALVATLLGALVGALAARYLRVHQYGFEPPVDLRITWLIGIVVVATSASLVAAAVPARAASRTNLLQALRGQVSSRTVHRRMPLIGLLAVLAGGILLFQSVAPKTGESTTGGTEVPVLLVYLGMPLFFGGAVMTVPYVLRMTGALAAHLPVAGRIAVRDVSRQRTRATASVGAILATVAVCTSVTIFGASLDRHDAKSYVPSYPLGSGAFVSRTMGNADPTSDATTQGALDKIRAISPGATALWSTSDGLHTTCASSSQDQPDGLLVHAIDDQGMTELNLTTAQRSVLNDGGAIVLSEGSNQGSAASPLGYGASLTARSVNGGKVDLFRTTQTPEGTNTSCKKISLPATTGSPVTITRGYAILGSALLMKRSTLTSIGLHAPLSAITAPSRGEFSTTAEKQLAALAPREMDFSVEHGFHSPVAKILAVLTVAFAAIVLLTTVVSTLLNDAESRSDAATLATIGASKGLRRRITGAHAASIAAIGAAVGTAIGIVPGLVLAREATGHTIDEHQRWHQMAGTYVIPWWPLFVLLIGVPLLAAVISMIFTRRTPPLTRREA